MVNNAAAMSEVVSFSHSCCVVVNSLRFVLNCGFFPLIPYVKSLFDVFNSSGLSFIGFYYEKSVHGVQAIVPVRL